MLHPTSSLPGLNMARCLLFLLPLMTACSEGSSYENLVEAQPATDTGGGWMRHDDPMGFTLECPASWSVEGEAETGQVWIDGSEGEEIIVWPFLFERTLDRTSAPELMRSLLEDLDLGSQWQQPRFEGETTLRARSEEDEVALLGWVPTPRGSAGILYVISTLDDAPAGSGETLQRVLESFRLTGTGEAASEQPKGETPVQAAGVRWVDPTERAFSTVAPAGWRISGGVVRPNSILAQARIEAASPDGAVQLYFGDNFPWFIEPNQFVGPGQIYTDPMGGQQPVWYYLPGSAFALQYFFPQRQGRFETISDLPRPEIAEPLRRMTGEVYDAGEARYRFQAEGRSGEGVVVCVTRRLFSGSFASWYVYRMAMAEAPAGRLPEAEAALGQIVGNFQLDPGWVQREAVKSGINSRIITEAATAVSKSIRAAFENQQRTQSAVLAEGSKARRGVEELRDPVTGARYEVTSGSRYHWVDPQGRIVGTETDTAPNIDFRGLLIANAKAGG